MINRLKNRTALRDYLTENGVAWTQHATNADLKALALKHIMMQTPGHEADMMGFGKHDQETYGQVFINAPDYVKWCVTTSDEEMNPHWRLTRFANWARNVDNGEALRIKKFVQDETKQTSVEMKKGMATSSMMSCSMADEQEMMPQKSSKDRIAELEAEIQELRRRTGNSKSSRT